jgi:hypothetical protein
MTLAQQAKPSRVPVHEGVTRGVDGMPFREGIRDGVHASSGRSRG